ncbi:tryptophan synthase subunit alpha [Carboxylicivirga sp. A043]|uniref:tryptophan synthase subunit alpha n=1 Tax=Carboxylicivirga litoralis TaxID=2816963 RepID=UPI0021CB2BBF|nr:tryptophan synthase subunit alpha [Carboxylicivirga sp. A043]MCU4154923.1 tryptophan synthase subunit alpha [Carboxylicivirga sp. A043]
MNRLQQLFRDKKDICSVYFTAGYPELDDTMPVLQALENGGADLVELGMPFSDPLADGPTIQASSEQALEYGMSIKKLFEQIKDMRQTISMPVVLMGYFNPVFKYGVREFIAKCQEVGVDGLILPDLPFDEYREQYQQLFEEAGIANIFLITPQTSNERIKLIDANSKSFIYVVSSASVTGAKKEVEQKQIDYFNRVNDLGLKAPRLIGFGISNRSTFETACQHASGAIIGSAFVKLLGEYGADVGKIKKFIKSIKPED